MGIISDQHTGFKKDPALEQAGKFPQLEDLQPAAGLSEL